MPISEKALRMRAQFDALPDPSPRQKAQPKPAPKTMAQQMYPNLKSNAAQRYVGTQMNSRKWEQRR